MSSDQVEFDMRSGRFQPSDPSDSGSLTGTLGLMNQPQLNELLHLLPGLTRGICDSVDWT